jgi:hypothetical protein
MDGNGAGYTIKNSRQSSKSSGPFFWVDSDDDWNEADIPPRPWIVPGFLMRGVLTLVVGAPVVGKSVLGLLWATVLALGEDHGRFKTGGVERRVVVVNAEDPLDEQRRRMSALLRQYNKRPADLRGRLIRIGPTKIATLFMKDEMGEVLETDAFDELKKLIADSKAEVVILDPLVELTVGVDENSNSDMSQVAAKLRTLAVDTKTAIVIIHHARKGQVTPGDLDASRGASAVGGAVRGGFTLTGMTETDATALGINPENRSHYIRLDDAKPSYTPAASATWYERLNIDLANGDGAPTLLPWNVPKDVVTPEMRTAIEAGIARGIGGEPWSPMLGSRPRSVKHLMTQHGVTTSDGQKKLLIELLAAGFEKVEFKSSNRRWNQGLRSADGKPAAKWKEEDDE